MIPFDVYLIMLWCLIGSLIAAEGDVPNKFPLDGGWKTLARSIFYGPIVFLIIAGCLLVYRLKKGKV